MIAIGDEEIWSSENYSNFSISHLNFMIRSESSQNVTMETQKTCNCNVS